MANHKPAAAPKRMAVVGGGWAGCAAAVELSRAGHDVTLFEAARTLGGRARRVEFDGGVVDNGQHILLGAYGATLRLLQLVGVEARQALLNLPLQMRYPPGCGGMDFVAPRWPAPLHLAAALLRADGLARADKMALARFSSTARWMGWQLHSDCSVSELLERFDQSARLIQLMWRPLCLAALNTPPERASAKIFLNVLRDSLGARRRASDMLLPKVDLSALFPDAAAAFVRRHGGAVHCGASVTGLRRQADGGWQLDVRGEASGGAFDGVILATPAAQTAALLEQLQNPAMSAIASQLAAFEFEAISTCYLQYPPGTRLERAFFALIDAPQAGHWGQFVFDRGQLDPAQSGMLAVVISASAEAAAQGQAALAKAVARQLADVFRRPELAEPAWSRVITDKRATYACSPGLARPDNATGLPGLALAGDYTHSDYPATIESAVRSGVLAAAL
ncbi:squalene-associated FAD-dependent desaturase [Janthinobacterium sp. CG_S6]|nr:squalene-associated FAD-dependent desaturase [Janthinobacterium sp. CG_S6]